MTDEIDGTRFGWRRAGAEMAAAFRLLSRLPMPSGRDDGAVDLAKMLRYAPLVGVAVAAIQAVTLAAAAALRLPPLAGAALTLVASLLATGALHEDGLADVADACGGHTVERRLAIMRDSRIGAYGALALGLSLLLRAAALAGATERKGMASTIGMLVLAAALSRALMLVPLVMLPPARRDGLAHHVGAPTRADLGFAVLLAAGLGALAVGVAGTAPVQALGATTGAALAVAVLTAWAARRLGGVTGDVVGACQQCAEIVLLLILAAQPI